MKMILVICAESASEWSEALCREALALMPPGFAEENARFRRAQDRRNRILARLLVLHGLSMLGALPSDGLASWRTDSKGRPFLEETKRTTRLMKRLSERHDSFLVGRLLMMKKPSERHDSSLVGRLLVVPRRSPAYDEACASSSRPRVDFNISHTDGAVVAAISIFGRIGVDIERRREGGVEEYLAAFTERERAWILAGVPAERMLRLWTRKEAILKAAGTGFLIPPSGIDVLEGGAIIEGARYSARELDTDFGSLPSGKRLGTGGGSDLAQDEDAGIFRCHLAVERADYHVLRKGDANGMLPEELLRDEIELRYVSPEEAVENLRARKRSRV